MRRVWLVFAVLPVFGCGGLRLGNTAINEPLSEDWKNRNFFKNTAIFKHNLEELVGSVLTKVPGERNYRRGRRIVAKGFEPSVKMIDDGTIYESKIDRGAAIEGSYLAWAANLKENEKRGVVIQDVSQVFIPTRHVPWAELAKLSKDEKKDPQIRRYYVQGVLLSTMLRTKYTEIEAGAKGVIGDTIGINGRVYARHGSVVRDFRIALELIDIDQIAMDIARRSKLNPSLAEDPRLWAEHCLKRLDRDESERVFMSFRAQKVQILGIQEDK